MDQYEILRIIGQGAFGNAYLALHKHEFSQYVIKKIQLRNKTIKEKQNIFNEVKLLQQFKHINIVGFRDAFEDREGCLNIVMEYCEGGDINQLIENCKGKKFDERQIVDWAAQIALAIFYLHDKRILHRDLKTPNIFINGSKVKLGDFGISKVLDESVDLASTNIGTPYYMSPQQYKHKPYSYKSDIWAFGCILYEMCNQKRPFEGMTFNGLAVKILEGKFAPVSEFYSNGLRELVKSMLAKNSKDRPSIVQFLSRPIIRKRVTSYLKESLEALQKDNGDQQLINCVIAQAAKLKIGLETQVQLQNQLQLESERVQTQPSSIKKKSKANLNAEKLKAERQKTRQNLIDQLAKFSEQGKQKRMQLKRLQEQRKAIVNSKSQKLINLSKVSKKTAATAHSKKQSLSIDPPPSRQQPKQVEQQQFDKKPFKMQQQYGMQDFEQQQQQQQHSSVQPIREQEEEQERGSQLKELKQIQPKPDLKSPSDYQKDNYVKNRKGDDLLYKAESKSELVIKDNKSELIIKDNPSIIKEEIENDNDNIPFKSDRTLLLEEDPLAQPISEEQVKQIREELKLNNKKIYTLKNELSNIDFSISSSDEEEGDQESYVPAQYASNDPNVNSNDPNVNSNGPNVNSNGPNVNSNDPNVNSNSLKKGQYVMKRKIRNPTHARLTQKINDLKHSVQSMISRELAQKIALRINEAKTISRQQLLKMLGQQKIGVYHLINQINKLGRVLERVPNFI